MELQPSPEARLNRLFYACHAMRGRLDRNLNRIHRNALHTVSRYLGAGEYDYAEFFGGRLINGYIMTF